MRPAGLEPAQILGFQADGHMGRSLIVLALGDLAMGIEPREGLAVGMRHVEMGKLVPDREPGIDRGEQPVEPFAGEG